MSVTARTTRITIANTLGVPVEEVLPELNIKDDLAADSLDMVELVIALENEFSISIPDEHIDTINTVADAIRYTEQAVDDRILNSTLPV